MYRLDEGARGTIAGHPAAEGLATERGTACSVFGARVGATRRHLAALGLDAGELLAGSGLGPEDVDPGSENLRVVDAAGLLRVYTNALHQSGRADLGLCYGEAAGITEYGPIGYAMLSAATDLEAVNIALTYQRLYYGTMARMSLLHEQGRGVIRIDEQLPPGLARRFFMEMLLAGFLRFNQALVGGETRLQELRLAYPAPPYAARYPVLFQCPVVFGSNTHELVFDTGILAQPLPNSDVFTARACEQVCRELLAHFDRGEPMAVRVRRLLRAKPITRTGPTLGDVAAELGCHPRTLHRRLRAESASYQQIKDGLLREHALGYLGASAASINGVARQLGFDSPSNFRRAIRRWTGLTPQQWRQRQARVGVSWVSEDDEAGSTAVGN